MIGTAIKADVRIEVITPDTAHEMLKANSQNRRVYQPAIAVYARQMEAGKWLFLGDPIRFGRSGRMLDGQHRLLALIKANVSLPFVVIRGLENEDEIFAAIDTGKNRSASDVLSIEGMPDTSLHSAAARKIIDYEYFLQTGAYGRFIGVTLGKDLTRAFVSNNDLLDWVRQNDISGELQIGRGLAMKSNNLISRRDGVFYYWLFSRIDATDAMEFMTRLCLGLNLTEKSPIFVLRRRLETMQVQKIKDPKQKHTLIIKAWNDFRTGREVTHYKYDKTADLPTPI